MGKILDNFCGYVNVGDNTYTCNVSKNIVTLLPAYSNQTERYAAFDRVQSCDIAAQEFLYGTTDNTYIAIMCRNNFHTDLFGLNPSARFATPLIVKAAGNASGYFDKLTEEWDKFHAITFKGGNINAIFNPEVAVEPLNPEELLSADGVHTIKSRPWSDYTRTVDVEIYGEKATLTLSVSHAGAKHDAAHMGAYSLGELNSFIRFSFEKDQGLDKIERYYRIVRSLVAVLTMQNNVTFELYLSQRNSEGQFIKSAICKVFDHYENYSAKQWHRVIPICRIFNCLPNFLEKIECNGVSALLAVLPDDNRTANLISITNVQDMCTALEVAYS